MTSSTEERARELSAMSREQLDALPYGAIRLAHDATILSYNATESHISGREANDVVGRNFFTDVAPCTDVKEFHGAFTDLIEHRAINRGFDFTFPFETPVKVKITMLYEQREGTVWVLVDRWEGSSSEQR